MDVRRTVLRILAPLALIAAALALVMIVSSFNNSSDGGTSSTQSAKEKQRDLGPQAKANRRKKRSTRGKLPQGTYIVKAGDTLGSIAETTGVPVTKLQELNPDLDQFSLEPGQKIKLK